MEKKLKELKEKFLQDIEEVKDSKILVDLKTKYLGRKGKLTTVLKDVKDLAACEKPKIGEAELDTERLL